MLNGKQIVCFSLGKRDDEFLFTKQKGVSDYPANTATGNYITSGSIPGYNWEEIRVLVTVDGVDQEMMNEFTAVVCFFSYPSP